MPDWTVELREKVIKMYEDSKPTPETTTEIVAKIAEELGDEFTPNGVRSILVRADKYMKKTQTKSKTESTGTKVNKSEAISNLAAILESNGLDADEDILGKLTGKAAVYFTAVIEKLTAEQD